MSAIPDRLRIAVIGLAQLSLTACTTGHSRMSVSPGPTMVSGPPFTSVALLGSLHVSPGVRARADSLLEQRLRTACPSVTVLSWDDVAPRLAAQRLVAPRELSGDFARQAREVLGVDLLLAPMALGLTYDTRNTVAGVLDVLSRPAEFSFEDRAGIALEGWDLRLAERTVWIVRLHGSDNSWTANPEQLLRNAVADAVQRLAPQCAPSAEAVRAEAPPRSGTAETAASGTPAPPASSPTGRPPGP